jgi:amino acid efflux transporter
MHKQTHQLSKTLGVGSGTAMAVSLVIGAGILVVPGIAYHQAGTSAVYSWLLNSLFIIPLLLIFSHLGARYPSAGGISGFTQAAFGRNLAAATEILMLGTFTLALPGVAFTAASYLGETFKLNIWQVTLIAFAMLLLAVSINVIGTKVASKLQQVLAFLLVAILIAVTLSVFIFSPLEGEGIAPIGQWGQAIPTLGLVFFAYAGWELLAFTTEEYKDPKRDFPKVIAISFVLVSGLYILIAVALQLSFHHTDPRLLKTPIAMLFETSLGVYSTFFVSLCGFIIIMAHLIGAIWGASRLVFSSARAGILPAQLARIHHNQVPVNAVLAIGVVLLGVAAVTATGSITVTLLFTLAGQNFFILSGFAVLAYLKMASNKKQKMLGWLTAIMVCAVTASFGIKLIYPLLLLLFGYLLSRSKIKF